MPSGFDSSFSGSGFSRRGPKSPFGNSYKGKVTVGQRSLSALEWIADKLSRPQYALTSAITASMKGKGVLPAAYRGFAKPTDEDKAAFSGVLKAYGADTKKLPTKIAAGALNFVVDPLLPLGIAGKTAKGVDALKASKLSRTLGEAASKGERALLTYGFGDKPITLVKGAPVLKAMSKVGQAIGKTPVVKEIKRALTGTTGIHELDSLIGKMRRANIFQVGESQGLVNQMSKQLRNISKKTGVPVSSLMRQVAEYAEAPQHSSIYKNIPQAQFKALEKVLEMMPKIEKPAMKQALILSKMPPGGVTKEEMVPRIARVLEKKRENLAELKAMPYFKNQKKKIAFKEREILEIEGQPIGKLLKAQDLQSKLGKSIDDKVSKWKEAFTARRATMEKDLHPEVLKMAKEASAHLDEMFAKEKDISKAIRRTEGYLPHLMTDEYKKILEGLGSHSPEAVRLYGNTNRAALERQIKGKTLNEINDQALKGELVSGVKFKAFHDDVAYLLGSREVQHARFINKDAMLKDVVKNMGSEVPQDGFYPVIHQAFKSTKNKEGRVFFHKDVADELNRYITLMENPDNLKQMEGLLSKVSQIYKAYTLPIYPAYHFRNVVGNVLNNFLGGVTNPNSYLKALKIQRGEKLALKVGEQTLDAKQIMEMAKKDGVVGVGLYKLESGLPELIAPAKKGIGKVLAGENVVVEKGREIGDFLETNARLAHYVDLLQKGYSREAARQSVMTHLFDYSDLGWLSKKARLVAPFFTWTLKNVPLQFSKAIERPGVISGFARAKEGFSGPDRPDEKYFSEYMIENLPAYVRTDKDGKHYYFLAGSWLPSSDINKILGKGTTFTDIIKDTPRQTLETLVNMIAPYFKEPVAQAFNYDPYFKTPIELFPGQKQKLNLPGKTVDIPARAKHALSQFRPVSEMSRVLNPEVGTKEKVVQSLTGLKTQVYDEFKSKGSKEREIKEKLTRYKALKKYYNREPERNAANIEAVDEAIRRLQGGGN